MAIALTDLTSLLALQCSSMMLFISVRRKPISDHTERFSRAVSFHIITDKGTTAENNSGLASVRENSDRAVARVP